MYSLPLTKLGHQLAIDSVFKTAKGIYIVVGVVCQGLDRTGVSFVPYAIRKKYQSEDKQYLSDEKYIEIHNKLQLL